MKATVDAPADPNRPTHGDAEVRCVGEIALDARWEPWMDDLLGDSHRCEGLIDRFGSPLHLHHCAPFHRNIVAISEAASRSDVDLSIYFARKANKCIGYVQAAARAGIGVDVAGDEELRQVLAAGVPAERIIVTAAVKPVELIERCIAESVRIAIDNEDEAQCVLAACARQSRRATAAVRIGFPSRKDGTSSRFGFSLDEVAPAVERWREAGDLIDVDGLHFHLDGYAVADRVAALDAAMQLVDRLRRAGLARIDFIDMGGGFPMRYLDDAGQWETFWQQVDAALLGRRPPLTYRNHGLGRIAHDGVVIGPRHAYPHAQQPTGTAWLSEIFDRPLPTDPGTTVSQALRRRGLRLHCEPGRALLDGCGMTVARVEHRKRVGDDWLIGLAMNSSNCRSQKSELFADPRLLRGRRGGEADVAPMAGYLTGAYCAEGDLISHRRLVFPDGVAVGDLIAFPNTAGYLMHFTESRSHQFPLPVNVDLTTGDARLDRIDE